MTGDTEFGRVIRAWIQEDAHEDPSLVLARVDAIVSSSPLRGAWLRRALAGMGGPARIAFAAGLVTIIVAVAIGLGLSQRVGPGTTPFPDLTGQPTSMPSASAAPETAPPPTAVPTIDSSLPALANDAPCTRTWPVDSLPPPNPYHHEDLERMVPNRDDVGGLAGFDLDMVRQGYQDNAELRMIEINPRGTCADIQRLGRIEGYGNAYSTNDRVVMFAVHLFWTAEEASEWADLYVRGLADEAGSAGASLEIDPEGAGITDSTRFRHEGGDGVRDFAVLWRGPVVGWVVDLSPDGAPTVDVGAATADLAERIEAINAEVPTRAPQGLSVAQLLSAPLPQAAYGGVGADFAWDPWFGGCQDAAERGFIAGPEAQADAIRFGRVTGCTAMYGGSGDSRVFSSVHVYGDAAGAADAVAENIADQEAQDGERFPVDGIGQDGAGVATAGDIRVVFRVRNLLLWVSLQGVTAPDQQALVIDLARQLESRVTTVTAR